MLTKIIFSFLLFTCLLSPTFASGTVFNFRVKFPKNHGGNVYFSLMKENQKPVYKLLDPSLDHVVYTRMDSTSSSYTCYDDSNFSCIDFAINNSWSLQTLAAFVYLDEDNNGKLNFNTFTFDFYEPAGATRNPETYSQSVNAINLRYSHLKIQASAAEKGMYHPYTITLSTEKSELLSKVKRPQE